MAENVLYNGSIIPLTASAIYRPDPWSYFVGNITA